MDRIRCCVTVHESTREVCDCESDFEYEFKLDISFFSPLAHRARSSRFPPLPTMKLYTGLFYSPGLSYLPFSPLRDLQLSNPSRVQLFSLITSAELAQLDPVASGEQGVEKGEALVYNHLELRQGTEGKASRWLRQKLWSGELSFRSPFPPLDNRCSHTGAVLSFHHPSAQYPYAQHFSPTSSSPFSSPNSRSSQSLGNDHLNLTVHFASLILFDGVLPPDQDQGAGITVHDEMDPVIVGFRNKVEVRIARAVDGVGE